MAENNGLNNIEYKQPLTDEELEKATGGKKIKSNFVCSSCGKNSEIVIISGKKVCKNCKAEIE